MIPKFKYRVRYEAAPPRLATLPFFYLAYPSLSSALHRKDSPNIGKNKRKNMAENSRKSASHRKWGLKQKIAENAAKSATINNSSCPLFLAQQPLPKKEASALRQ
jgi:hypothetical protein